MTETALNAVIRRIRQEIAKYPAKRPPLSEHISVPLTRAEYEEQMARYRRNGEIGYWGEGGVWIPATL